MAKPWRELTAAEQKRAMHLLHRAKLAFKIHDTDRLAGDMDLLETAINKLDSVRSKFEGDKEQ